ncbi:MAG TPA: helix-turn-helix domain-containing protein [Intrasporangium sp.]|nr:helix-turn-helix domain-containing protein [Intrasporangium sp.]
MFIGERAPHEARDGDPASPLESRTRSRVLHMVSAEGPITAAELGRHLDLTPAAVRRHLDALVEQGAVVEHEPVGTRRGRGRPARAYVVSEAGHQALEADYDSLAVEVLHYLAEHAGPQAVADFARARVAALEERYAAELASVGDDPTARAETLVDLLSSDGFAASARPVRAGALAGVQLCQGHCPVQHAAEQFPTFCEAETDAFSRLLGVHVQRLATLAGGHHVCTTFVPAAGLSRKSEGAAAVDARVAPERGADPGDPAQRHTTTSNEPTKERSRS